jgi:hypothetical protein
MYRELPIQNGAVDRAAVVNRDCEFRCELDEKNWEFGRQISSGHPKKLTT